MSRAPIALAMDSTDLQRVSEWARAVAPHITCAKVGLELFLRHGRAVVDAIRDVAPSLEVFLDLKLHDIPNTVAGAARSVAELSPRFLTVHALGGPQMIEAAVEAVPDAAIAAVTVLTSHSAEDLHRLGITGSLSERALALAQMSVAAGARAIVCSPHEVQLLRSELGGAVELITPGVRPRGADLGDQQRVATPEEAIASGASLLVIGRPITGAYDSGGMAAVEAAARAISAAVLTSSFGSASG